MERSTGRWANRTSRFQQEHGRCYSISRRRRGYYCRCNGRHSPWCRRRYWRNAKCRGRRKKKKEGEEDEEEEDTNQTEVYNEDSEQQRTINTATEDAAKEQIKSNDVDVSNLVQNVAGTLPGGEETIINDAAAAGTNISQAENAANGLVTKVAAGESDGTEEGENVLNAAMVSAANMSVTTEKAATQVINEQPDAEISVEAAKSAIAQTESTTEALSQAATQVQDPELVAKMQKGVNDIKAELTRSQDLLAEAIDTMAQKTEEEEEKKEEAEEEEDDEVIAEQDSGLLEEKIEVENTETLPGQMNADAVKRMVAEREEKQKAVAAAKKAEAEQATDEDMSTDAQFTDKINKKTSHKGGFLMLSVLFLVRVISRVFNITFKIIINTNMYTHAFLLPDHCLRESFDNCTQL